MSKSFQNKNDVSSSGFEESETDESSSQNRVKARKVIDVIHSCTDYQGLKRKEEIKDIQIDSDEEDIYLLRVPKCVNPKDLVDKKFSLTKKSKVKTDSNTYCITPLPGITKPQLLVNSRGLRKIVPVSTLQLQQYVETEKNEIEMVENEEEKPLPNVTIDRHIIFGDKYKSKINLQEEIKNKLKEALQRFEVTEKKPKKKKTKKSEEYEDKSLLISQILEEKLNSKKLKRSEKSIGEDSISINENSQTKINESIDKKKNKKQKNLEVQNIKNEIIIHDQQIIELENMADFPENPNQKQDQNLNDSYIKKNKKKKKNSTIAEDSNSIDQDRLNNSKFEIKKEIRSDEEVPDSIDNSSSHKKNKKKRLKNQDDSSTFAQSPLLSHTKTNENVEILPEVKKELISESEMQEVSFQKKKRKRDKSLGSEEIKKEPEDTFVPSSKKRRLSILSSTIITEKQPDFKPDVSAIEGDVVVNKKKNKKKSVDNQKNMIQDLLSSAKNNLDNSKSPMK